MTTEDGQASSLHAELAAPAFHLLLCGPLEGWDGSALADLTNRLGALLAIHHLYRRPDAEVPADRDQPSGGVLVDRDGLAFARLGVRARAAILVRPDGHVACRSEGPALDEVHEYLAQWLPYAAPAEGPGAATSEA